MSATLGGLIKDFRLRRNISQLEIATQLGWKESSQLSRIEQGKVIKPSRLLIDRIAEILSLDRKEKNTLLFAGNYLPTPCEVKSIREEINPLIESWKYPVSAYDFSWRIIHQNSLTKLIYYENENEARKIEDNLPYGLELIFDKNYSQIKFADKSSYKKLTEERRAIVTQYKYSQKSRLIDTESQKMIARLIRNDEFREMWETAESESKEILTNYSFAEDVIPARDTKERLSFHIFVIPMMEDPRIDIEFQIPADNKTSNYFRYLKAKTHHKQKDGLATAFLG